MDMEEKMEYTLEKKDLAAGAMPIEQRSGKVPTHGICNLRPADRYRDVLALGNGKISACVYGQPWEETIVYSHERLYFPTLPKIPSPPPLAPHMKEIRALIREGRGFEAANLASDIARTEGEHGGLLKKPASEKEWEVPIEGFMRHSGAALRLRTRRGETVTAEQSKAAAGNASAAGTKSAAAADGAKEQPYFNYLRTLDYVRGEAAVYWEDEAGCWERRGFVCRPRSLHLQRLTAPGRAEIALELTPFEEAGEHEWERMSLPPEVHWQSRAIGDAVVFEGWYDENVSQEGYAVVVRALGEGWSAEAEGSVLTLRGEGELLLAGRIEHYEKYEPGCGDALLAQLEREDCSYGDCMEENLQTHGKLMNASLLTLTDAEDDRLSVEELQKLQHRRPGLTQKLLEKLYDAGRYFQIVTTGELPPLIGQWNINVNLQVCSGIPTNMTELMHPYFNFIEKNIPDFQTNAKTIFGCRGMVADIHPDMHNGLLYHFSRTWPHEFYTAGTGWMYHEFYAYYLATGDEDFLREHVVPGLKEIAAFYEDFLQDKDENGRYMFYPCLSPENNPMGESPATINAVMDVMVCREVLEHLLEAVEILGLQEPRAARWREILDHLPVLLVDDEGGLKEWAWEAHRENYNHRCVSHHYDVWPADKINYEETPELAEAVMISNRKRPLENDSCHGIMHRIFCAIRLGDTEYARGLIAMLLNLGFVNCNLTTNHYPYRVVFPDMLGSFPAVLAELLVYSKPGRCTLLPGAEAVIPRGQVTCLRMFNFAYLENLRWDFAAGTMETALVSLKEQTLRVCFGKAARVCKVNGTETALDDGVLTLRLNAGERAAIEAAF